MNALSDLHRRVGHRVATLVYPKFSTQWAAHHVLSDRPLPEVEIRPGTDWSEAFVILAQDLPNAPLSRTQSRVIQKVWSLNLDISISGGISAHQTFEKAMSIMANTQKWALCESVLDLIANTQTPAPNGALPVLMALHTLPDASWPASRAKIFDYLMRDGVMALRREVSSLIFSPPPKDAGKRLIHASSPTTTLSIAEQFKIKVFVDLMSRLVEYIQPHPDNAIVMDVLNASREILAVVPLRETPQITRASLVKVLTDIDEFPARVRRDHLQYIATENRTEQPTRKQSPVM